jgi:hypothetical protein
MQNLPVRIGAVPALYGWPVLPRHRLSTVTRLTTIARRIRSARPNAGGYVDDRLCRPAAPPPLPEPARKAGKCSPSPTSPPAPQPQCALIMMIQEVVAPLDRWPERDRTPSVNPQASGRKPARPYHVRGLSRSAARFARILTAIHSILQTPPAPCASPGREARRLAPASWAAPCSCPAAGMAQAAG